MLQQLPGAQNRERVILKPTILILILHSFGDVNLSPTNSGTEFGAIKTVTILIYDAIKEIQIEIIGGARALGW